MDTNTAYWIMSGILLVMFLGFSAYVWAKHNLPKLAERGKWFASPKKGRIIAVKIGEKIIGYFGNLFDQNRIVDRKTGEIIEVDHEVNEDAVNGSLWSHFGVIWVGFGSAVHKYMFESTKGPIEANSIYLENQLQFKIEDLEDKDKVRINVEVQVLIETAHAGLSLNYPNWVAVVKNQIISAVRAYVANHKDGVDGVFREMTEKKSDLFDLILGLNIESADNPSIQNTVGQKILDFSMMSVDFTADFKAAMEAKKRAEEARKAALEASSAEADRIKMVAEAELFASEKKAEGIKKVGEAQNSVLEKTAKVLTKKGAEELEKSRALADAIKGNGGLKALSIGSGQVPFLISDDDKK